MNEGTECILPIKRNSKGNISVYNTFIELGTKVRKGGLLPMNKGSLANGGILKATRPTQIDILRSQIESSNIIFDEIKFE